MGIHMPNHIKQNLVDQFAIFKRWMFPQPWNFGRKNKANTPISEHIVLRPDENGHNFADDIFKCIFLTENYAFFIQMELKLFPQRPQIYN